MMKWWSRQKFLRVLITLTPSALCKSTMWAKVCLRWNAISTSLARTFQQHRCKRPRCFLEASCKDSRCRPLDPQWQSMCYHFLRLCFRCSTCGWNARIVQSWKSLCRWIASLQITTKKFHPVSVKMHLQKDHLLSFKAWLISKTSPPQHLWSVFRHHLCCKNPRPRLLEGIEFPLNEIL